MTLTSARALYNLLRQAIVDARQYSDFERVMAWSYSLGLAEIENRVKNAGGSHVARLSDETGGEVEIRHRWREPIKSFTASPIDHWITLRFTSPEEHLTHEAHIRALMN